MFAAQQDVAPARESGGRGLERQWSRSEGRGRRARSTLQRQSPGPAPGPQGEGRGYVETKHSFWINHYN